jgi:three-Cys-motif partner protein
MSDDYFEEMKEWSLRKLGLLQKYLDGFVRILGSRTGQVFYVDGFSGPGVYEDDSKGSPVRAAEYAATLVGKPYGLHCINVELDEARFANLVQNTAPHAKHVTNLAGAFGEHVDSVLNLVKRQPAIFFLDPFGVKGLEWRHLSKCLQRTDVTEVLLRINPLDLRRLAGSATSEATTAEGKRQLLTDLFGILDESRWVEVWNNEGEDGLVRLYMSRLGTGMQTSTQMPQVYRYAIRSIEGQVKYYLIFATRHAKGAVLMNDVVYSQEQSYERDVQEYKSSQAQQLSLFGASEPTEEEIYADIVANLSSDIWARYRGRSERRLQIRAAMLSKWFGLAKGPHFTSAFKAMETDGRIVKREGNASNDETSFTFGA